MSKKRENEQSTGGMIGNIREKDFYRRKIIEMVVEIENVDILEYIYKMTVDIMKEDEQEYDFQEKRETT